MRNYNDIINEYKNADESKRLNLYLECPELRGEFMDIEYDSNNRTTLSASNNRPLLLKWLSIICSAKFITKLFPFT